MSRWIESALGGVCVWWWRGQVMLISSSRSCDGRASSKTGGHAPPSQGVGQKELPRNLHLSKKVLIWNLSKLIGTSPKETVHSFQLPLSLLSGFYAHSFSTPDGLFHCCHSSPGSSFRVADGPVSFTTTSPRLQGAQELDDCWMNGWRDKWVPY